MTGLRDRFGRLGLIRDVDRFERKMDRQLSELRRHTEELQSVRDHAYAPNHSWTQLAEQRLKYAVKVDQPLALVSQVQRSGGTLVSQLLDAHPQVHAHPGELHLGYPAAKRDWPQLRLDGEPAEWFKHLRERLPERAFVEGYEKYVRAQLPDEERETFPMLTPPSLIRFLFMELAARGPVTTQREILDVYMTAYFNGWLDNQNLYGADKRWVTAFAARTTMYPGNVEKIFADYPDGKIISVIREPVSWYASAAKYRPEDYADLDEAGRLWRECSEAMAAQKRAYPDRVHIIEFNRLLAETEDVMREVAAFLDIEFLPVLTEPTFNGMPIRADSSFAVASHGVLKAPLERRDAVEPDKREKLEELTPLYEDVVSLA